MAETVATLAIPQGDTFQFEFEAETPGPVVLPPGGTLEDVSVDPSFELSYYQDGNKRLRRKHIAHAALIGNTARLTITKEGSDLIGRQQGSWSVFITIGFDRWRIANGAWRSIGTSRKQTELELAYEHPDGPAEDVAALPDATVSPSTKRVWVANGRCRTAINVSNYQRMPREQRRFRATGLAKNEAPTALDANATTNLLWTATKEGGVYVDSIVDQTNPIEIATPFVLTYLSGESIVDICSWGAIGEEVCVLLTNQRLFTLKIVAGAITQVGVSERVFGGAPMTDTNPAPGASITDLQIIGFERVVINKDTDGRLVGFVRCFGLGYETPPLDRPFPRHIVLCDLDLAGGFVTPRFKQDTGVFTWHSFYNPFPVAPLGVGGWEDFVAAGGIDPATNDYYRKKQHYMVSGMQTLTSAGVQYLYVSHGRRNQVRVLNVQRGFTTGITVGAIIPCHPNFGVDPYTALDLCFISVDPNSLSRFVVVERDNEGARLVDSSVPGTYPLLIHNRFAEGPIRKAPSIALAGKPWTLWTVEFGASPYTYKVLDASGASLSVLYRNYWYMNIDGIKQGRGREIWTLTFGGIIRMIRNGDNGEWAPDPDGYSPSELPDPYTPGAMFFCITEQVDFVPSVGGVDRVVTATGIGGFMEWIIDSATRAPGQAIWNPHPNYLTPLPSMPTWENFGQGTYYSNAIAHITIGTESYVLYDMTCWRNPEYGLFAHHFNKNTGAWEFFDVVRWGASMGYAPFTIPFTDWIDIYFVNGNWYAVTTSWAGISVVLLDPLASVQPMRLVAFYDLRHLFITPPSMQSNRLDGVTGGVLTEKHVILTTWEQGVGSILWVFAHRNRMTELDPVPVQKITEADIGLVAPKSFTRGFGIRYRELGRGRGAIYHSNMSATHVEFEYVADRPNPVRYVSALQSDYQRACTDAIHADLGDGTVVLFANNTEGFAIGYPSLK